MNKKARFSARIIVNPGSIDGVYVLYDRGEVVARWKILCGNELYKDASHKFGRIPHFVWKMTGPFDGDVAAISPVFEQDKENYKHRFNLLAWPFNLFSGGSRFKSSFGGIAWPKSFKTAKRLLQRAFEVDGENYYIDCYESAEGYQKELEAM